MGQRASVETERAFFAPVLALSWLAFAALCVLFYQ
jgi:hypothetical protein